MQIYLSFITLIFSQLVFGQTTIEKLIHGKIMVESGQVAGVTIINLTNEKSTVSDKDGAFYILAKVDDLLVFSSINLEYHRRIIEPVDLKSEIVLIKMIAKVIELEEVIVNKYPQINTVKMGIIPAEIKKYTPAERRLKVAGDFKAIHLLGLLGGHLEIDPILNAISGRTNLLKKELEIERKELALKQLQYLFNDNYFAHSLRIPKDYILGFQYYFIENKEVSGILNTKNKNKIEFEMTLLSKKYLSMIPNEN